MTRVVTCIAVAVPLALPISTASAQSLFLARSIEPGDNPVNSTPQLAASSLFFVAPTQPRQYRVHDIIHVIVSETSSATSSQTLETTKELEVENQIGAMIDLMQLLELRLQSSSIEDLDLLNLETTNEFTGEGEYDRQDRLSARIAAEVVDVKPNGQLVLRARKTIGTDEERRTITLTGIARSDDITEDNSVMSSQLADLAVDVVNEGEVRKGAKKGVITKALEFIFNF